MCAEKTGGFVVMSDSFSMHVFKDSFRKIFEVDANGYLQHAYNAKMEVLCSKEVKVMIRMILAMWCVPCLCLTTPVLS